MITAILNLHGESYCSTSFPCSNVYREYYSCKFSRYIYILQQTMTRVCTYMYPLYTLFNKCTVVYTMVCIPMKARCNSTLESSCMENIRILEPDFEYISTQKYQVLAMIFRYYFYDYTR
jgi:hypothetical protein